METKRIEPRFKPGDRVVVARKIPEGHPLNNDCGWSLPGKDEAVGRSGTVTRVESFRGNVCVSVDGLRIFPFPPASLEPEPAAYGNEE